MPKPRSTEDLAERAHYEGENPHWSIAFQLSRIADSLEKLQANVAPDEKEPAAPAAAPEPGA